jgi:hypothetical protein
MNNIEIIFLINIISAGILVVVAGTAAAAAVETAAD